MIKEKIIVTGSKGQLGSAMKDLAAHYTSFEFLFFDKEQLPINNELAVKKIFELHQPQLLVNAAAYTAVDKAEKERELALEMNGVAVGNLAKYCHTFGTKFIHISTDYVFNGQNREPLKENDAVDPINYYGRSKLVGEQMALEQDPQSLIIRTAWVYSAHGHNFVKTMMRLMNEQKSIRVVNDQHGAPTYAADLAEAIMQIISSGKWIPGIYNFSNRGNITWFDFANAIKSLIQSDCVIHPVSTQEFPTPAKRPAWSVLDTSKIVSTYNVELKDWKQSLEVCMKKLLAIS